MKKLLSNKLFQMLLGMISGLAFAPLFFVPALFALSALCYQTYSASDFKEALMRGFLFGFGHFLIGMYWISIGVSVYIYEFWWAIPFALFGLPLILACFIASACGASWLARKTNYFHIIFCLCWIFFEWVRSWIFTGFPWNLLGYALSFSDILIQTASIFGIYGLSFLVIYIATSFYYIFTNNRQDSKTAILTSIILIMGMMIYGNLRLKAYLTDFSAISVRLVQPSIPQVAKWDENEFWKNLDSHINLSIVPGTSPDLIIWSEAALVAPFRYAPVKSKIMDMLEGSNSILITGGISDNEKLGDDYEIYTTLQGISPSGELLFEYRKSHLVPFGEYMPLKKILPIKKLTHGFIDYTEGDGKLIHLNKLDLKIKSLICYEAIFPDFVRTSNAVADLIINVTNDAWYGNSSGPYQHLHISRMRAVENGLPILRVGNNGISAIIDPLGRIIKVLGLNKIGVINGYLPNKISHETLYSKIGNFSILLVIALVLIIQPIITFMRKIYNS